MILILTDMNDKHADIVCDKLSELNQNFFRFNLDVDSLKKTQITFNDKNWIINSNNMTINTNDIKSIWARRAFVELTLDENCNNDVDFKIWRNEWNKTLLGLYVRLKKCNWLGEIRNSFRGENKYLQREIAHKIGFIQPMQIVSNNKEDLIEFTDKNNDNVVLKLMSQEFYETEDGFKGLYVNKITKNDLNAFNIKDENPIVLQEYIDKDYEVRYTVVGDKHFVCKIDSQISCKTKVDWRRYDITNTPHLEIKPPNSIKEKVNKLMDELNLNFGALDFVVKKNGDWVFLEINTMGQWLWIETLTGMKISDEITQLIIANNL